MDDSSPPLGNPLAALRIIDANYNRASEGLRVLEEYCRFALGDRHLNELCKQLRHDLTAALAELPAEHLHVARDTQTDVGTTLTTASESERHSLAEIAAANCQRAEQALRVIEEYVKLLAPEIASAVEGLRYRTYIVAKACTTTARNQDRLQGAQLYVLLDAGSSGNEFAERASQLIAAGVHMLQLRDKQLDDRTLLSRGRLLRRIIDDAIAEGQSGGVDERENTTSLRLLLSPSPPCPLFIVNDRPDLAVLARADGVHLGQEELTIHDARRIVGPEMLIGVSTHTIEQARQAVLDGANYLGCGPVFPSGTKHFDQFPGLDFLRQVAAEIGLPAFAIGGITADNLRQVLSTGFKRVAVTGAFADSTDVGATARVFRSLLVTDPQQ